jgi:hypothetical protein
MGEAGFRHHGINADAVEAMFAKQLRGGFDNPLAVGRGLCFGNADNSLPRRMGFYMTLVIRRRSATPAWQQAG